MRKTTLTAIVSLFVAGISIAIYAQSYGFETKRDAQITLWEHLAEQGDTAAMHLLIAFYNENAPIYDDFGEIIEAVPVNDTSNGSVDTAAVVDETPLVTREQTERYAKRLDYWLNKGIAMNYPEAVSEMRHIEPDNKIWQYKADSLDIQFLFPIISE